MSRSVSLPFFFFFGLLLAMSPSSSCSMLLLLLLILLELGRPAMLASACVHLFFKL
jgi:hypothetical protein